MPDAVASRLDRLCPHQADLVPAALSLLDYCRQQHWAGYDPYDALNSPLTARLEWSGKWPRIALTQLLKRAPLNLRPLLLIPRTQNPKALGLFISSIIKLQRTGLVQSNDFLPELLLGVEQTRAPGPHWSWGYSFPWQGRSMLVTRGQPNLVCTVFVGEALLDLFEETGDGRYLAMAISAASYLTEDLFWTGENNVASFGYPLASAKSRVHNANFLAAAFLLRVHLHSPDAQKRQVALAAIRYSAGCQRADGSWPYGELPTQAWIDNFHTGYNLCALRRASSYLQTDEFDLSLERGYRYYRSHFFNFDAAPKYFHDALYPIDSHCVAQSIITLLAFRDKDPEALLLAGRVFEWAFRHLRSKRGFFYYQKQPWGTNRISYMRWTQAWMLLALATLLENSPPLTAS